MTNITDELKIYELSLIWKEAEYNFAFWEQLSDTLDWDKAYKKALSAVLKTQNLREYYWELKKFVSLLRDGHTYVWSPKCITESPEYSSKLPIRTRLVGGKRVIDNVKPAAYDKVKRWSILNKVNGIDFEEYAASGIYPYIWHEKKDSADVMIDLFFSNGPLNSKVELEVEHNGKVETVVLTRTHGDTDWIYEDIMLKPNEILHEKYSADSHSIAVTNDGIAIITIDTMANDNLPNDFFANFPLLEKAKGYIIDIRNNGGGSSYNADAVAAAFIGGQFTNQRALHPIHIGAYKAWGRALFANKTYEEVNAEYGTLGIDIEKTYKILHRRYYEDISTSSPCNYPGILTAPLVVLTSSGTASAAEDFLVALDYNNRATFVGSASYGSTGQPLIFELESGGGFAICTRHNIYPDGREFINAGVKPHVGFEMTLNDYKSNVDSVMNKGLAVLREQLNKA